MRNQIDSHGELPPGRAFLHVVNDHRWLVACACGWREFKKSPVVRGAIPVELSNVDVGMSAGVLVYARSLIEFYAPPKKRPTDISISDFGMTSSQATDSKLELYRRSIERHLLHLTAYRDVAYRTAAERAGEPEAVRIDWDAEYLEIVEAILGALAEAAEADTAWAPAFQRLHEAARSRLADPSFRWPDDLQRDGLSWLPA